MLSAELHNELQTLAATVAPELGLRPLYIFTPETLPGVPMPEGVRAWERDAFADPFVRDCLIATGLWRGEFGPIICMNTAAIAEAFPDDDFLPAVRCDFLHELAHIVPVRLHVPPMIPHPAEWFAAGLRKQSQELVLDSQRVPPWGDDDHHGIRFIRRALHLHGRATAAGWDAFYGDLCAGITYGLAGAWKYRSALGNEPERMAGRTFREIEATDLPAEFSQLWNDDVNNYQRIERIAA